MTDTTRWKSTVYIGGLAPLVTTTTLQEAFLPFGEIADVSLPKNENPQTAAAEPHRGFAYVEFEDADDAKEAIDNMDQAELFGRVIKVSAAKAPKSAGQGLGAKTAVWEQVCFVSFFLWVKLCWWGWDVMLTAAGRRKGGLRSML
jgi:RNA recognition motif-containing protein